MFYIWFSFFSWLYNLTLYVCLQGACDCYVIFIIYLCFLGSTSTIRFGYLWCYYHLWVLAPIGCSLFRVSKLLFATSNPIEINNLNFNFDVFACYRDTYGMSILTGSTYRSRGGQRHQIEKVIVHRGYDEYTNDNDISLIKVNKQRTTNRLTKNTFMWSTV